MLTAGSYAENRQLYAYSRGVVFVLHRSVQHMPVYICSMRVYRLLAWPSFHFFLVHLLPAALLARLWSTKAFSPCADQPRCSCIFTSKSVRDARSLRAKSLVFVHFLRIVYHYILCTAWRSSMICLTYNPPFFLFRYLLKFLDYLTTFEHYLNRKGYICYMKPLIVWQIYFFI